MPIERGMLGMMHLITTLGGYTMTAARAAGTVANAAVSPVNALNLMAKPTDSEINAFGEAIGYYSKSTPVEHIVRTERVAGPLETRKSMRGGSAPRKRSKKPKFVRYRTGGCPPGYTYDPKRKMCIHNSYR